MKLEDFNTLQELTKKEDKDLVFENYKKIFKEENPDVSDDDLDDLAKSEFEEEYKLTSQNEKTRQRAEARIAKEAAEVRTPLKTTYETVKSKFDEEASIRRTYPEFAKKLESVSSEVIPAKFEVFKTKEGDEDIPVGIDVTDEAKKEISDKLVESMRTQEVYDLFREGKFDKIKELSAAKLEDIMWKKYRDDGFKKVASLFETRGKAKVDIGAKNSFALKNDKTDGKNDSKQNAEQEVLNSLKGEK